MEAFFGNKIWNNVVMEVTHWAYDQRSVDERVYTGKTEEWWTNNMNAFLQERYHLYHNLSVSIICFTSISVSSLKALFWDMIYYNDYFYDNMVYSIWIFRQYLLIHGLWCPKTDLIKTSKTHFWEKQQNCGIIPTPSTHLHS